MLSQRISLFAAAFLLSLSTQAPAETMQVDGTGHGTASSEVMPVTESLIVVNSASMYEGFDTMNPDNPFATATGPCFGAILIDKGAVSGDGLCHYTDGDGEVAVIRWMARSMSAEGRTLGDWEIVGGTGKWAAMTGSGTFDAGGEADAYTNAITGSVTTN